MSNPEQRRSPLAELVAVIVIAAIIGTIAVPKFGNFALKHDEATVLANLKTYRKAIELFRKDVGLYPARLSDLAATKAPRYGLLNNGVMKEIDAKAYRGPYVTAIEADIISDKPFDYNVEPGLVGQVKSSSAGKSTDGTLYSNW